MPAAIAIPAIATAVAGGAAAGATIYGAHKSASAAKDAAKLEAQSTDKALEAQKEEQAYNRAFQEDQRNYARQQYASYADRLAPYLSLGGNAMSQQAALTGNRYGQMAAPQAGVKAGPYVAAPTAAVGTVMLKAPNGMTRAVPADQAEHYLAKGAVRV